MTGAVVALIGMRATWVGGPPQVITVPGVNGFQSANLRVGSSEASGIDIGLGWEAAAAVTTIVCAALAVLSRGRARTTTAILAMIVAVYAAQALGRFDARAHAERRGFAQPTIHVGAFDVALLASVGAALGAMLMAHASRTAGEARLPEGAPSDE